MFDLIALIVIVGAALLLLVWGLMFRAEVDRNNRDRDV